MLTTLFSKKVWILCKQNINTYLHNSLILVTDFTQAYKLQQYADNSVLRSLEIYIQYNTLTQMTVFVLSMIFSKQLISSDQHTF